MATGIIFEKNLNSNLHVFFRLNQVGVTLAEAALETFAFNVEEERSTGCGAYLTLLTLNQQRSQQNSPLSRLIYTINSLKDLVVLHRKFKIKLKLAEFMDPLKSNVVSWILDWTTSPQEIFPLLSSFLLDYMHRWDLEQDATLAEYVTVCHLTVDLFVLG